MIFDVEAPIAVQLICTGDNTGTDSHGRRKKPRPVGLFGRQVDNTHTLAEMRGVDGSSIPLAAGSGVVWWEQLLDTTTKYYTPEHRHIEQQRAGDFITIATMGDAEYWLRVQSDQDPPTCWPRPP